MKRKTLATALLALLAIFALPVAAANAVDGYTTGPDVTIVVNGSSTMTFTGFVPGESTTASAPDNVGLAVVKAVTTATKNADGAGAVSYVATSAEIGTFTITVTGDSGRIAVGTLTVLPIDTATGTGNLPNTGFGVPALIIWGASGALLFGAAIVSVLVVARRKRVEA
jgi:hypothetical protein